MVTANQITEAIHHVRDRYIASNEALSYWAINNGLCEDFATEVATALGGETNELFLVGNGNFSVNGDDFSGYLDWNLLQSNWAIEPSLGLTEQETSAINFGTHV